VIERLLVAALSLLLTSPPLFARGQDPSLAALRADLDRLFDEPLLARALVAAHVESLGPRGSASGPTRPIYTRNADRLVVPASNMKLLTIAAVADALGWDYRYETRLEVTGTVANGTLRGDVIVVGSGDPSIGSPDGGHALVFLDWAEALRQAGIQRVDGRIVGDDDAFEDEGLGAGWAWDNLAAGYSAPVGALNYNENAAVARISAASLPNSAARVEFGPAGHGLDFRSDVITGAPGSAIDLTFVRAPNTSALALRGTVPAAGTVVLRTAAVDNPTLFFAEAFRLALVSRGITVSRGAWDIDALGTRPSTSGRRTIAVYSSPPLSVLAGYAMKVSQNMYAEAFLKTLGRTVTGPGTSSVGLAAVRTRLTGWGVPMEGLVLQDGSGLSRYNYVTASALVSLLTHVWRSERLRGPFVAELPVGGQDGTLDLRMRGTALARNVQAKTGTLSNVRALSGYLERADGEKLVFSIIVNHYTAPSAEIDAIVEKALERLLVD
jgi:D-alanyl-D-alanine carboxypeptidase/D-alanyl-D-alanine-endopeptidase (penicillin-binding protein 4)